MAGHYEVEFKAFGRWCPSCGPRAGEASRFKTQRGARQRARFYSANPKVRVIYVHENGLRSIVTQGSKFP